jgi:DhnA family fructose-bisphosphate aldolase class Ia
MSLDFAALRELRATDPSAMQSRLLDRTRRTLAAGDGRLFIVAADHTARGALGVRGDRLAMADRYDLLTRLATALENPLVDGVLGTPDIIDDLAALGLLEGKVVVGSMNRGGLRGASFEMDDRFTAYDVDSIAGVGLDMAKLLVRIDLADAGSVATLESTGSAVTAASAARLPILIEPFMSRRIDGHVVNDLSADAVIHSVAIASALGASSAYSWLKLPVVDDMESVMKATTLPTLLLGGDPDEAADETFESWSRALALPGVRGLVVGRTLLYPADGDVAAAVAIAAELVHGRATGAR